MKRSASTLLLLAVLAVLLAPTASAQTQALVGALDNVQIVSTDLGLAVIAIGWAADRAAPATAVRVRLTLAGEAGRPLPSLAIDAASGPAVAPRADLVAAFPALTANHGFRLQRFVNFAGQPAVSPLTACVESAGSGAAALSLGCRQLVVPDRRATGHIDGVTSPYPGVLHVIGWNYDPDSAAFSGELLEIRAGAQAIQVGRYRLDRWRPDVALSLGEPAAAFSGWEILLVGVPSGVANVCFRLPDIGSGAAALELGCLAVAVAGPAPGSPFGRFDSLVGQRVRGWALDPDLGPATTPVEAWVDGLPGTGRGIP